MGVKLDPAQSTIVRSTPANNTQALQSQPERGQLNTDSLEQNNPSTTCSFSGFFRRIYQFLCSVWSYLFCIREKAPTQNGPNQISSSLSERAALDSKSPVAKVTQEEQPKVQPSIPLKSQSPSSPAFDQSRSHQSVVSDLQESLLVKDLTNLEPGTQLFSAPVKSENREIEKQGAAQKGESEPSKSPAVDQSVSNQPPSVEPSINPSSQKRVRVKKEPLLIKVEEGESSSLEPTSLPLSSILSMKDSSVSIPLKSESPSSPAVDQSPSHQVEELTSLEPGAPLFSDFIGAENREIEKQGAAQKGESEPSKSPAVDQGASNQPPSVEPSINPFSQKSVRVKKKPLLINVERGESSSQAANKKRAKNIKKEKQGIGKTRESKSSFEPPEPYLNSSKGKKIKNPKNFKKKGKNLAPIPVQSQSFQSIEPRLDPKLSKNSFSHVVAPVSPKPESPAPSSSKLESPLVDHHSSTQSSVSKSVETSIDLSSKESVRVEGEPATGPQSNSFQFSPLIDTVIAPVISSSGSETLRVDSDLSFSKIKSPAVDRNLSNPSTAAQGSNSDTRVLRKERPKIGKVGNSELNHLEIQDPIHIDAGNLRLNHCVTKDVDVSSGNVTLKQSTTKDVNVSAGNITADSSTLEKITTRSGSVTLVNTLCTSSVSGTHITLKGKSKVEGDVFAGPGQLTIQDSTIQGTLTHASNQLEIRDSNIDTIILKPVITTSDNDFSDKPNGTYTYSSGGISFGVIVNSRVIVNNTVTVNGIPFVPPSTTVSEAQTLTLVNSTVKNVTFEGNKGQLILIGSSKVTGRVQGEEVQSRELVMPSSDRSYDF